MTATTIESEGKDDDGVQGDIAEQEQPQPQQQEESQLSSLPFPASPSSPSAAAATTSQSDDSEQPQSPLNTSRTNNNNTNSETTSRWRRRRRRTTTTTTTTTFVNTNSLAEELQSHLDHASFALIQTLLEHLSSSSTATTTTTSIATTTTKGLSLPAAAVGWLSLELFPPHNIAAAAAAADVERGASPVVMDGDSQQQQPTSFKTTRSIISPAVRQRLLRVLPSATHVRLTAEEWPPLVLLGGGSGGGGEIMIRKRRRQRKLQQLLREVLFENVAAEDNTNNNNDDSNNGHRETSATNFLNYYHALIQRPQVDMRVFPKCQVLLLDQVPPNRIHNLYVLHNTLEVLRIERSSLDTHACLTSFFAGPLENNNNVDSASSQQQQQQQQQQDPLATTPPNNKCDLTYSRLTHVKIAHCSLSGLMRTAPSNHTAAIGDRENQSSLLWTTHLQNLQSLCLAHNQLSSEQIALAGLSQLPRLVKLDLSFNYLTSLRKAHYRLGNVQTLLLSHNQLMTAEGIDRLYALQTLWLDHNCIADLSTVSGLARLPELQWLRLEGNPLEQQRKQQRQRNGDRNSLLLSSSSSSSLYRIQVLDLFRQRRPLPPAATYRDLQNILPNLDGKPASLAEMKILKEQSFMAPVVQQQQESAAAFPGGGATTTTTTTTVIDVSVEAGICERPLSSGLVVPRRPAAERTRRRRRQAHMDQPIHYVAVDPLVPQDSSKTTTDFTLSDVLESLCEMEEEKEEDEAAATEHDNDLQSGENNKRKEKAGDVVDHRETESFHTEEKLLDGEEKARESLVPDESVDEDDFLCREDSDEMIEKMDMLPPLSGEELVEDKRPDGEEGLCDGLVTKVEEPEEEKKEPVGFEGLSVSPIRPDNNQRRPPLVTRTSTNSAEKEAPFETDTAGTDGHSLPGTSVATDTSIDLPTFNGITPPFARRHVSDVSETPSNTSPVRLPISFSGIMSNDEHSSLHSSNGTPLRDDESNLRRYQLAEENSTFEGPDAYKNIRVHEDLELYFRLFVFPLSKEDDQSTSAEGDEGPEWRFVLQRLPRIQLWPIDRRLWDQADRDTQNFCNPEEFRRIWKEKVVACGKSALRRLTPNRGARFGFHGELLWADANSSRLKLETVAECRKVIVCCSNKSLYFILDHDKVTLKSRDQKRKFPLPIPLEARFKDAIWPHALARHPFSTLRVITIGFGFQRLTLRFGKSATPSEEDFTYILLTSSKVATVSLLKEFQDLSHDCRAAVDRFALPKDGLLIDNDDRHVLDALGVAVAPDVLGVVLHYQILEQRWRRGERGNVRRVCVLTDAKIYLLDEDYVGDGSESFEAGVRQLGESVYRLVDSAPLSLVGQVQAADADPNAITIVIQAASRFQRSHNWRLICRDRHGAERLVEDVRRAIS